MLAKLALVALLALGGCAAPRKLDVELRNRTTRPARLRLRAAGLERVVVVPPGGKWSGWVPVVPWVKRVDVDLLEEP